MNPHDHRGTRAVLGPVPPGVFFARADGRSPNVPVTRVGPQPEVFTKRGDVSGSHKLLRKYFPKAARRGK